MIWGDIERGAHFGTFDFGVLNPGEVFELSYVARTDLVTSNVTFAGRGELWLDDPFGLRQRAFTFRDLAYSGAGDVNDPTTGVPEPATRALVLVAGAWQVRRRRPELDAGGPRAANAQGRQMGTA